MIPSMWSSRTHTTHLCKPKESKTKPRTVIASGREPGKGMVGVMASVYLDCYFYNIQILFFDWNKELETKKNKLLANLSFLFTSKGTANLKVSNAQLRHWFRTCWSNDLCGGLRKDSKHWRVLSAELLLLVSLSCTAGQQVGWSEFNNKHRNSSYSVAEKLQIPLHICYVSHNLRLSYLEFILNE